jgi:ClpP class serine protease
MLEMARLRLIERLERQRNSRVIVLIHRQETLSLLGFPLVRYISIEDSEAVLRAIHMTDWDVPIDLVLHTPGGLVLAAEQIACALQKHPARVTVFVPHYAMSGGTLIALAADEIVMDENAVLGPVDPQLGQHPAASVLKVLERKPISEVDDDTIIMADIAEKALRQVKATVFELLHDKMDSEQAERLATTLSSGVWTHDYPITVREARELGLPVSTDMPPEIYRLMALYPQTAQRRPSVEYIPLPRSRETERPRTRGNA